MKNKEIKNIIIDETIRSFEGEISFIKFHKNITYGPFYRVDYGNMAIEMNDIDIIKDDDIINKYIHTNSFLTPNIDHLIQSRSNKLKEFVKKYFNEPIYSLAISFIDTHYEEIELDARYNHLQSFKYLFPNKYNNEINKSWFEKSPSRWCGLEKPKNLKDANDHYYLPHLLFPKSIDKNIKFLFEFYFELEDDSFENSGLFFGKTYLGNSIQFKYNSNAARCIKNLKCIGILTLHKLKN